MLEGGRSGGPFTFHMEVHSCTQTQDRFKSNFVSIALVEATRNKDYPSVTCAPTRKAVVLGW